MNWLQAFFSTPVHVAIGAIYGLLILASIISFTFRKLKPGDAATELSKTSCSQCTLDGSGVMRISAAIKRKS